jgi:hypothetical protein
MDKEDMRLRDAQKLCLFLDNQGIQLAFGENSVRPFFSLSDPLVCGSALAEFVRCSDLRSATSCSRTETSPPSSSLGPMSKVRLLLPSIFERCFYS